MKKSQAQRVEELSELVGGRFKLTTLILKRMRQYYLGGRTFMPKVRNQDELFDMILDQIEDKDITLRLPGQAGEALKAGGDDSGSERSITPDELLGSSS